MVPKPDHRTVLGSRQRPEGCSRLRPPMRRKAQGSNAHCNFLGSRPLGARLPQIWIRCFDADLWVSFPCPLSGTTSNSKFELRLNCHHSSSSRTTNLVVQRAGRSFTPTRPPMLCPKPIPAIAPVQAPHAGSSRKIPIAHAAPPQNHRPPFPALVFFGRRPPARVGGFVMARIRKPAQNRTHAAQRKQRRFSPLKLLEVDRRSPP